MPFPARIFISAFLIKILLAVLLFNGFITNFLSFSETNLGSAFVDLLLLTILLHFLLHLFYSYYLHIKLDRIYFYLFTGWLILLVATVLKLLFLDNNAFSERLLGLRNNFIYLSLLLYVPLLFKKETEIKKVIGAFLVMGLILVLFSLLQFAFSAQLPPSLVVLRGEGAFSFYGTDIIRPTALLGNTIIYSSFTIILFSFYLAQYLYNKRRKYLVIMALIALANIVTFTRAALVGLVIVVFVSLFLRYGRLSLAFIGRIAAVVLLVAAIAIVGLHFYRDSFIVQRVTGQEASTQGSTNEHFQQILDSIAYLQQHPFVGSGIGTQGASGDPANKIITDGYWFQLYLENGIILGTFYLLFYIGCFMLAIRIFYIAKSFYLKQLCMAFVAFSAYFYAASFLNSAYAGRTNFILYWLLFGLLVAQYLIEKRERYEFTGNRR